MISAAGPACPSAMVRPIVPRRGHRRGIVNHSVGLTVVARAPHRDPGGHQREVDQVYSALSSSVTSATDFFASPNSIEVLSA